MESSVKGIWLSVSLKLFQNRKLNNNKTSTQHNDHVYEKLASLGTWDSSFLVFPFLWLLFFILHWQVFTVAHARGWCYPAFYFVLLLFLRSPNAHSHTHDPKGTSPLLWTEHSLPLVFQVHLGTTQARYSRLLLSSSGCTIWSFLLMSPSQQATSPSALWLLVETSTPLMQMTQPPKLFSNFVISSLLPQPDTCHLLSRIMQSSSNWFSCLLSLPSVSA